ASPTRGTEQAPPSVRSNDFDDPERTVVLRPEPAASLHLVGECLPGPAGKVSSGPPGCLLSRTATAGPTAATSPRSARTASRSRWRTAEGRGVTGRATTGGRTGSMSWRRSQGRGTGASTGTTAGVSPGPGSAGEGAHGLPAPARGRRVSLLLPRGPATV